MCNISHVYRQIKHNTHGNFFEILRSPFYMFLFSFYSLRVWKPAKIKRFAKKLYQFCMEVMPYLYKSYTGFVWKLYQFCI